MKSTFEQIRDIPNGFHYLFLLVIIALMIPLAPLTEYMILNGRGIDANAAISRVSICTRADANKDGTITLADVSMILAGVGGPYDANLDVYRDGKIDSRDSELARRCVGTKVPIVSNAPYVNPITTTPLASPALNTDASCARSDVNGDKAVTLADVSMITANVAPKAYNPKYDVNNDNKVDQADVTKALGCVGYKLSASPGPITPTLKTCASYDLDGNGAVTLADVSMVLNNMTPKAYNSRYDLNGDGTVDLQDAYEVNAKVGTKC